MAGRIHYGKFKG